MKRSKLLAARLRARGWCSARSLLGFGRSEEGGLLVFGLLIMVLMLVAGGIAVDTMRYEAQRTRLQATTDSAVLAAASLSQVRDAREVVEDYFDKAGLLPLLGDVTVDEGLNYRNVQVTASTTVPTFFMRLVGIGTLQLNTLGAAEERINNVEVSLVLDLSGSMNSYNRLENLKDAAGDFIDTLLGATSDGQISISIVPYTGQVNAGPHILSQYDVAHAQGYSHCIDFDEAHYATTALPLSQPLVGAGHSMPFVGYGGIGGHPPLYYNCPVAPGNAGLEILPLQSNPEVLKNRINGMEALGATSIDIGMKWGVALLDPSFRPVVDGLIAQEQVAPDYTTRPFDFDEPDTLKVAVLMTDGDNFPEYRLIEARKSGMSDIWYNPDDNSANTYSLYNPATGHYWQRRNGSWRSQPYGGSNAIRLSYPELLNRATVSWIISEIYDRTRWPRISAGAWVETTNTGIKDQRLQEICAAARGAGMIVFTVAFEAPSNGRTQLRECASSMSHFFDVEGLEIRTAFRSIAVQISQLRLTQ
ncbi:TadE/TadG family type IV pilus assembly protein [Alkalilacustris brevis]|uniref:TadE/TadG family type IV pilus assembly protein n=1 Tax=Alkalilacustris brevis TaxID=2026338 RepID=UPI000E0DE327|nr:TadE/TadG family type IV pilus assembly protein [Alkalilacustris brevis]